MGGCFVVVVVVVVLFYFVLNFLNFFLGGGTVWGKVIGNN